MLRSVDLYVAPNTGGESFGMILTEAMAAGTTVVASDLDAFRRVLDGGRAGALFPIGDSGRPGRALGELLDDPAAGPPWPPAATEVVAAYDWPVRRRAGPGGLRRRRSRPTGGAWWTTDVAVASAGLVRSTRASRTMPRMWWVVAVVAVVVLVATYLTWTAGPGRPAARAGGRGPRALDAHLLRRAAAAAVLAEARAAARARTRRRHRRWTPSPTSARPPRTT